MIISKKFVALIFIFLFLSVYNGCKSELLSNSHPAGKIGDSERDYISDLLDYDVPDEFEVISLGKLELTVTKHGNWWDWYILADYDWHPSTIENILIEKNKTKCFIFKIETDYRVSVSIRDFLQRITINGTTHSGGWNTQTDEWYWMENIRLNNSNDFKIIDWSIYVEVRYLRQTGGSVTGLIFKKTGAFNFSSSQKDTYNISINPSKVSLNGMNVIFKNGGSSPLKDISGRPMLTIYLGLQEYRK